ncbi:hypothetical protein GOC13_07165 [Sinorhizobium meliloti]|nr:hypothetical protein [Sinorhizobium meliloti]
MVLKTNLHKNYATDSGKEENGTWQDFDGGIRLKIRRLSSQASMDARKEAEKPYTSQLRSKNPPSDILEKVLIAQLAFGVIADWEGIGGEDGPIPYSGDVAFEILSDEELRDFRGEVLSFALNKDSFRKADVEAALGN